MRVAPALRNSHPLQVSFVPLVCAREAPRSALARAGASVSTGLRLCVQTACMTQTSSGASAGSGIGAAVARRLGKRGFRLILGGRTPGNLSAVVAEIRAAGGQAEAVTADVTLASDVERLIAAAGPQLDALIHSAGQGHCLTIDELDEEEWRQTLDVAV